MGCYRVLSHDEVQAALSARIDGEPHQLDDDVVDAHLAGCAECRSFRDRALTLTANLRQPAAHSAPSGPRADLSADILAGVEPRWREAAARRHTLLTIARVLLVVMGVVFGAWALTFIGDASRLTGAESAGASGAVADPPLREAAVHAAGLRFGLASAAFFVAWRPSIAKGALPTVGTMAGFLAGFAMRDIALGQISSAQVGWLIALVAFGVVLLWTWAIDSGFAPRRFWRSLNAQPS